MSELQSLGNSEGSVSEKPSVLIDEAISEIDDDGSVYTAFGFLVHWRGQRSAGYRRFKEFVTLHSELSPLLPNLRFPLWRWPPKFAQSHRDPDVVDMRARGLQTYLASALDESQTKGAMPLPLSRFLRLDPDEDLEDEEEQQAAASNSVAYATLLKMRGHCNSMQQLQQKLEAALLDAAEEQEQAYEDLEGPGTLASRLGPPISQLDSLLTALNVQLSMQGSVVERITEEEPELAPVKPAEGGAATDPTVMGRARSFLTRAFSSSSADAWPEARATAASHSGGEFDDASGGGSGGAAASSQTQSTASMYYGDPNLYPAAAAAAAPQPVLVTRKHSGGKARVVNLETPSLLGGDADL